jgi:hypothetical protein
VRLKHVTGFIPESVQTSWSTMFLEKLIVSQLVKFPAFCGARSFITAFTKAHRRTLSSASWIQSTSSQSCSLRLVYYPPIYAWVWIPKLFMRFVPLPCMFHALSISSSLISSHAIVSILLLLHFRPIYSPHNPVLKHDLWSFGLRDQFSYRCKTTFTIVIIYSLMFTLLLLHRPDDKGLWTELSEPAFPFVIQYSRNYDHRKVVLQKYIYFISVLKWQLHSCFILCVMFVVF